MKARRQSASRPAGINRNIVECKDDYLDGAVAGLWVLIETLWNVKPRRMESSRKKRLVLIEPLWNVKMNKVKEFSTSNEY